MAEIDLWLARMAAGIIPVDAEPANLASAAWLSYGNGRHPAALNFAGCISYALAKPADEPLLFVGSDFSKTDIAAASRREATPAPAVADPTWNPPLPS